MSPRDLPTTSELHEVLHGSPLPPRLAARRLAAAAIRDGYIPEALHAFPNREGTVQHWRIRLKNPETGEKWIRPMQVRGMVYELSEPAYPHGKPLYRLPELTAHPDKTVIVTEGELKADKLAKLGLTVTTSGSADSAGAVDWKPLAGRDVLIWPDHDEAGQRYADAVAVALAPLGCSVRVLDVAALGLQAKGDAADWLALHPDATKEDVLALTCKRGDEFKPNGDAGRREARAAMLDATIAKQISKTESGEEPDHHRNAPRPDSACLYGLIGDIARAGGDTTEANPYAVALNALAYLGCCIGRGPYLPVGNTYHHARLFTKHVGRSARGRKGDAVSLIHRIDMALRAIDPNLAPQVHRGGLSSREGLAFLIHDGFKEGKSQVEPIHDKRLWVIESEFANVLHQAKRDGNTLSSALRDCWDGVTIKPATKSNRISATDPHVSLSAAVTPSELLSLIEARELSNGFANRFLTIYSERSRLLAFPKPTEQGLVDQLAKRIAEVLKFVKADRWTDRDHMRMSLAPSSARMYEALYHDELNRQDHGPLVNGLLERRAPVLLRIAMFFAIADGSTMIQEHHIAAARAWVRYWTDSIRFIFSSASDEQFQHDLTDAGRKIVEFLQSRGRQSRTNLNKDCFHGKLSKEKLDAALDELLQSSPAAIVIEVEPRSEGAGSGTKFYAVPAKSAKSASCEASCGLQPDSTLGEVSEISEVRSEPSDNDATTVRSVRSVRHDENAVQAGANAHIPLNSLISPGNADTRTI